MVPNGQVDLSRAFKADGTVGAILPSLLKVASEMSIEGIAKGRKNVAQDFKFRGIDDVLNTLSPEWVRQSILVVPFLESISQSERTTPKGGTLLFATVVMVYTFTSAIDGTEVRVKMPGQAMDSGDKAMNKAISVAYKYAVIQLLSIPIEGNPEDRDPDFSTHKLSSEREPAPRESLPRQTDEKVEPKKVEPKKVDRVEPETVADAIERMTQNATARQRLTELLLKAYSVMTLDQIPVEKQQEAITQAETCLEAQRKAAAKAKK